MTWFDDVIMVDGEKIRRGFYLRILAAAKAAGIDPDDVTIVQGSWSGAGASAGTHLKDGLADIRIWNLPQSRLLAFVTEMRRLDLPCWLRTPQYGWTQTGPHLHVMCRAYQRGMSDSAKRQLAAFDMGLNGLANNDRDPFARPKPVDWKPPAKYATVKAAYVWSRKSPKIVKGNGLKRLPFGRKIGYIAVVVAGGQKWLVTQTGNYVRASRTTAKV